MRKYLLAGIAAAVGVWRCLLRCKHSLLSIRYNQRLLICYALRTRTGAVPLGNRLDMSSAWYQRSGSYDAGASANPDGVRARVHQLVHPVLPLDC